jgi:hypothetical protein
MKILIVLLTLLAMSGCAGPTHMTNDAIIAEAMKCEQVGLPWRQVYTYDGGVASVYCTHHFRSTNHGL